MMNQPSLAPLFEHARSWGIKDPGTWTYKMEEDYYHPTLLGFVMSERRRVKVEHLADLFVSQKSLRRKRDAIKLVRGFVFRRKRARFLMTENIVRYVIDNTSDAWMIYRKFAMREIAVREIQRTIRGYMGRTEALFLKILFKSAVLLQCSYRGKLARRRYLALKRKRHWAAAELQRHVRGVLSKRLAMNRLEGFLDSERQKLKKERWEWENAEMIAAVKSIQGQYRKLQARRKVHLLKDKKAREAIIEEEMEDMQRASKRDRKIYERQIEEWYERKRIAWAEDNVLESHTANEKAKIRSYQRKQKELEKKEELNLKEEHEEAMKDRNVEAWLKRWEKVAQERSLEYKEFCSNCMLAPDTPHERKMGKKLKEKVNKRYHDVLKRADAKHIPMEAPEARGIAMEEVLYIMGEEEKSRVVLEMKEKAKASLTNPTRNKFPSSLTHVF